MIFVAVDGVVLKGIVLVVLLVARRHHNVITHVIIIIIITHQQVVHWTICLWAPLVAPHAPTPPWRKTCEVVSCYLSSSLMQGATRF